ncbi:MAG: hypothetical protein HZB51_04040 [Chloroflexi bacterium]|nr:hypothetical protein [Chloroflexota bacterium]
MKTRSILICLSCLLVLFALMGCSSAKPTVDAEATINAAVQATTVAQANAQATVDFMVKQTLAAQPTQPPAATPTVVKTTAPAGATATKVPATPVPSVTYVTMTEEELAALIDQAVKEATAATTSASTTTATYAADGTLTTQEVQAMILAASAAQSEIAQAESAIQAYYDLYGAMATETLATLQAIEQDLNSMATSMNSMAQSLAQISTTLSQGLTLATSTITQLQTYATQASQAAAAAQNKAKNWTPTVQKEINTRATTALNTKPTNIPTDLKGTLTSVNSYVDTVKSALGDSKISKTELQSISLAGANATAGLSKFGGTEGQALTNSINNMTKQIARGEMPKAKSSLSGLEVSARSMPSIPSGINVQPPQPRKP